MHYSTICKENRYKEYAPPYRFSVILLSLFLRLLSGLLRLFLSLLLSLRRVYLLLQRSSNLELHCRACGDLDIFTSCRVAAGSGSSWFVPIIVQNPDFVK